MELYGAIFLRKLMETYDVGQKMSTTKEWHAWEGHEALASRSEGSATCILYSVREPIEMATAEYTQPQLSE